VHVVGVVEVEALDGIGLMEEVEEVDVSKGPESGEGAVLMELAGGLGVEDLEFGFVERHLHF